MINLRTGEELKDIEKLEPPFLYVYIMNTESGKIKIGKTTNIARRYQSLSGSNSQGNPITSVYCSKATSLYTIERILHNKFDRYRLTDTEWFVDKNDLSKQSLFNRACNELENLFASKGYDSANELRIKVFNDGLRVIPTEIKEEIAKEAEEIRLEKEALEKEQETTKKKTKKKAKSGE